jgi:hypothetical protein
VGILKATGSPITMKIQREVSRLKNAEKSLEDTTRELDPEGGLADATSKCNGDDKPGCKIESVSVSMPEETGKQGKV